MTVHTAALLAGLLLAPAWLVWLGHGLRNRSPRMWRVFWGGVIGNALAIVIVCIALFTPPLMWRDASMRALVIHWGLLAATALGAAIPLLTGAGTKKERPPR